jgi:hypothetical protein
MLLLRLVLVRLTSHCLRKRRLVLWHRCRCRRLRRLRVVAPGASCVSCSSRQCCRNNNLLLRLRWRLRVCVCVLLRLRGRRLWRWWLHIRLLRRSCLVSLRTVLARCWVLQACSCLCSCCSRTRHPVSHRHRCLLLLWRRITAVCCSAVACPAILPIAIAIAPICIVSFPVPIAVASSTGASLLLLVALMPARWRTVRRVALRLLLLPPRLQDISTAGTWVTCQARRVRQRVLRARPGYTLAAIEAIMLMPC